MLIEFRVENHRSLRDEQVLSMEAARGGDPADPRPRKVHGSPKPLLPAAAIYGANASGKSNVLEAVAFMRDFVLVSHYMYHPSGSISRSPFAWGRSRTAPSLFEATIVLKGIRYQYGFVLSFERVEEEWLYAWPEGRKQKWFEREGNAYDFGSRFKGANETIKSVTRPDALFLSTAARHQHPRTAAVFAYFERIRRGNTPAGHGAARMQSLHEVAFLDDAERTLREKILPLLRQADVGIVDARVFDSDNHDIWDKRKGYGVEFKHATGEEESWLSLNQESMGTQVLFHNAGSLLAALDQGALVLFDELDSKLHPAIAEKVVEMFNDPRINSRNAQLIFSTHNTALLGSTVGEPVLRRDQVWLTEKNVDGATRLYPLTDFKPRSQENLERGYLQGRYGAVPVLGEFVQVEE